jgi:hypothetical protein
MNALYYPFIDLPKDNWTFQTLLYWDKIQSIVPTSYIEKPDEFTGFMRELVQENLVEQIFPAQHLYNCDEFFTTFLKFVEKKYIKNPSKLSNKFTRIHLEKLDRLSTELSRMGLIHRADNHWLFIDENIANDYMSYLASFIGTKINSTPVSNYLKHAKFYDINQSYQASKKTQKIRNTLLRNIIPIPEKFNVEELMSFRRKYDSLLPDFRDYIDRECYKLVSLGKELREYETDKLIENIKTESKEIREILQSSFKSKLRFGSLLTIFSLTQVAISTYETNDIAFTGSLAALGGDLLTRYDDYKSTINEARIKPLAYISYL